ncbi:hypothetical protein ACQJBY_021325 [Aegilops geniculata]
MDLFVCSCVVPEGLQSRKEEEERTQIQRHLNQISMPNPPPRGAPAVVRGEPQAAGTKPTPSSLLPCRRRRELTGKARSARVARGFFSLLVRSWRRGMSDLGGGAARAWGTAAWHDVLAAATAAGHGVRGKAVRWSGRRARARDGRLLRLASAGGATWLWRTGGLGGRVAAAGRRAGLVSPVCRGWAVVVAIHADPPIWIWIWVGWWRSAHGYGRARRLAGSGRRGGLLP